MIDENNARKDQSQATTALTSKTPPPDVKNSPPTVAPTVDVPTTTTRTIHTDYTLCRSIYVELQKQANEQARHYAACRSENKQCHADYKALFESTDARHAATLQSERDTRAKLLVHQAKLDSVSRRLVHLDMTHNATAGELQRIRKEKENLTAEVSRLTAIASVTHVAAEACSVDLKSARSSATATKIQLAKVLANHTSAEDFRDLCPITSDRLLAYYGIFGLCCTLILVLLVLAMTYAIKHHRLLRRSQALLARAAGYVDMHNFENPQDAPDNQNIVNPHADQMAEVNLNPDGH
ncbi:MAG: hypothetical protein VXU46_00385 [Planctomycetota bacterium]|nr:hypothetical protein [Planctomycetota bacterium]